MYKPFLLFILYLIDVLKIDLHLKKKGLCCFVKLHKVFQVESDSNAYDFHNYMNET